MNQLSSVEPGAVLGDICIAARTPGTPLDGTLVELTHSWRFSGTGPVGLLSAALRKAGTGEDPDGAEAWQIATRLSDQNRVGDENPTGNRFSLHASPDNFRPGNDSAFDDLQNTVLAGFRDFMNAAGVDTAFQALSRFRILTALRRGPYGVENLNKLAEEILSQKRIRGTDNDRPRKLNPSGRFYDHRVIMITRNEYGLNLFNGDIGILLPANADQPEATAEKAADIVAWFEITDPETGVKGFRKIPCSMLPEHETAFAMTIHKSQGSEFTDVLLLLPPTSSPILTKELLYTGITRVVRHAVLWCNEDAFKAAAVRKTERASGLTAVLLQR